MAQGVHKITEEFEKQIADYTGAPYVIALDNQSNALFLSLMYENVKDLEITIPSRTYPSVPCEIIHAGGKVKFRKSKGRTLKGSYQLEPTKVWDAALSFTGDMYKPGTHMCVSFTGPYKHLKLGKGGAILTDDFDAYLWFKRSRNSGRRECSYHDDNLDMIGWNFYMMPTVSTLGSLLIQQFYNLDGTKKQNPDSELPYPDLSKFPIYENANREKKYTIKEIMENLDSDNHMDKEINELISYILKLS
jgi:dTDP-4-amino-4,6-dideoxygalactose transaminase